MKTWKMEVEEIQLLEQVKNFASYSDLAKFFNRSETTIRDNIFKIYRKNFQNLSKKSKVHLLQAESKHKKSTF